MKRSGIAITTLLWVSIAFAQGDRGVVTGTLTDPNGAFVPGASIELKHVSTGTVYKTETSRSGTFRVAEVPSGTYELLVPVIGFTFRPYVKKDLLVRSGQTLRTDARLEWSENLGTVGDDTFLTIRNRYLGLKGAAPRTPDGKPDFTGMWNGSEDPNPEEAAMLPWAAALQKERVQNHFKDSPSGFCLPGEVFPSSPLLYKFVQTPALLLQLVEDEPNFRQVFLNGSHPKNQDPTWKGHSVGKWDGDTLVVDTIGFNDKGWLAAALPHTESLHVVERYRRPDLAHLLIDVTIEDPGTLTKPWNLHMTWELAPGEELIEYICSENNLYKAPAVGK
jgi:carboxypeptidase family protein